jgi:hypothetical protein
MSGEESLEEQSFKNLIKYYENDLRRILNGASVNDILEFADRKTLRHYKIIGYRNLKWFLTERAMEILQTE